MNGKKKLIIVCVTLIVLCGMLFAASEIQNIYKGNTAKNEIVKTDKSDNADNGTNSSGNLSTNKTSSSKNSSLELKDDKSSHAQSTAKTSSNNSAEGSSAKSTGSSDKIDNKTKSSHESSGSSSSTKPQGVSTNKSDDESTLTIIDEVHSGKIVLEKNMKGDESVGYVTCKLLDEAHIPYKTTGDSSTLYFSAIDGIQERKAGQLSGWCYFVKKSGSSSFFKPSVGCGQYKLNKGDSVIWKYLKDAMDN